MKAKHFKLPLILNLILSLLFLGCSVNETNLGNENSQATNRKTENSNNLNQRPNYRYDIYLEYYSEEEIPRGESLEELLDDLNENFTVYSVLESNPCKRTYKLTVDRTQFEEYYGVRAYSREDCGCTTGHGMKKPEPDPEEDETDYRHSIWEIDVRDYEPCF